MKSIRLRIRSPRTFRFSPSSEAADQMSTNRLDAILREVQPGLRRGRLDGFTVQVFQLDGLWVAQALTHSYGVNSWSARIDDAKRASMEWIDANPVQPDHADGMGSSDSLSPTVRRR
jgi:hypothetical protein